MSATVGRQARPYGLHRTRPQCCGAIAPAAGCSQGDHEHAYLLARHHRRDPRPRRHHRLRRSRQEGVLGFGQIGRVDTAARSVVVKQGKNEITFNLAPDATLTQGATTIQLADLAADAGKPVKVRYTLSGTTKLADRVQVTAATTAKAPAKKG